MTGAQRFATFYTGIVAGAAGGLAEMAWVTLCAGITGDDPAALAQGVTTAAGLSAFLPHHAVAIGIGVHMLLALALGVALAAIWNPLGGNHSGPDNPYPSVLAALLGIWAINFLVVLPIVSPEFVHLAPYPESLASKLLFGAAAAAVFAGASRFRALEAARTVAAARRGTISRNDRRL
jgi:hypothetical protein